jgi:hypothetical protein
MSKEKFLDAWTEKDYEKGESIEPEEKEEIDEEKRKQQRQKLNQKTKIRISENYPKNEQGNVLTPKEAKERMERGPEK